MGLIDSLMPSFQSGGGGAIIGYTKFNPIVLNHNDFILNPNGATNMIYGKITVNTTADSGNINISHLNFI